ncbi:MAG TPA: peptidase [candidate division Zixibacteria bacterium]|jgi:membrane dipeptidase|nr:peptidase [candidate division Zixibacteria bacterium]
MPKPMIADLHCDTALRLLRGHRLERDRGHVSLDRLRSGGVGLQVFACWISPAFRRNRALDHAWSLVEAVKRETARHPARLQLVADGVSWRNCRRGRRIGVMLGIEGGHGLGTGTGSLEAFSRAGVRILTVTWNNSNAFACSAWRAAKSGRDTGLTALGRKLVADANRLGIVLDLSHSSEKTFWEVLRLSEKPVIASHSCAGFLQPHFRNLSDAQIKALAGSGGLLGINFYPGFLGERDGRCGLDRVADHFAYVRELAGAGCLALGSDFDGISRVPDGLDGPHKFPALLNELKARGFTARELRDVAGGNFLRLLGW